jgi:RNA polymerase-interacting CarD/CdnL/TRCF family regulator
MLRSAKQILISEIVIAQKSTYEEVEMRLNKAFG